MRNFCEMENRSYFHHKFWSSYEYLIYYQVQISSSLNGHIGAPNSDVDCGWLMNSEHRVQSLLNTGLFGVRF